MSNPRYIGFLPEDSAPDWFRGTSSYQMLAAEKMLHALRDDCEQGTTHRVIACLNAIGLIPIPENTTLTRIMLMSRQSDLAFFFGLLTLYYSVLPRGRNDAQFSFNEQLLMSSICHLDMVPTLRELDRILPKGHAPKLVIKKRKLAAEAKRKYLRCLAKWKRQNKFNAKLPYFQKLALPICQLKRDFSSKCYFVTTEYPYENYKNPHYVVPNVERWFADYQLDPNKRIARAIVYDEFNRIFDDYDAVHQKAEENEIICERHLAEYMNEWRRREERKLNLKYKCLKVMKLPTLEEKIRKQRVIEHLEHDIEYFRHKLRKEYKEKYYNVTIVKEDDRLEQLTIPVRRSEPYFRVIEGHYLPNTPPSSLRDIPKFLAHAKKVQKAEYKAEPTCECGMQRRASDKYKSVHKCGGCYSIASARLAGGADENVFEACNAESYNEYCQPPKPVQAKIRSCVKRMRAQRKIREQRERAMAALGNERQDTRQSRENIFFKAATKQVPYQFDYERIFRFDSPEDTKHILQEYFIKFLDDKGTEPREMHGRPNVKGAAQKCFRDMVKAILHKKNSQYEEIQKVELEQLKNGIDNLPETILARKYTQEFFNPDDKQLMDNMLKDALDLMKRNPYFVLASFPDVHKLPILRQWIYKRYGKRYTKKDKILCFNGSIVFANNLLSEREVILPPNTIDLQKKVTYRDLRKRKKEFDKFKAAIKEEMNRFVLRKSREFWFALRPYMSDQSPPTNTFFAYVPARIQDVSNYSLWRPRENINIKMQTVNKKEK